MGLVQCWCVNSGRAWWVMGRGVLVCVSLGCCIIKHGAQSGRSGGMSMGLAVQKAWLRWLIVCSDVIKREFVVGSVGVFGCGSAGGVIIGIIDCSTNVDSLMEWHSSVRCWRKLPSF